MEVLPTLWRAAGLTDVRSRAMTVERTFGDFDEYWRTTMIALIMSRTSTRVEPAVIAGVELRLRSSKPADPVGRGAMYRMTTPYGRMD